MLKPNNSNSLLEVTKLKDSVKAPASAVDTLVVVVDIVTLALPRTTITTTEVACREVVVIKEKTKAIPLTEAAVETTSRPSSARTSIMVINSHPLAFIFTFDF